MVQKRNKNSLMKMNDRHTSKTSKNLLTIIKKEIAKGKFRIKGENRENYLEGMVHYKKRIIL